LAKPYFRLLECSERRTELLTRTGGLVSPGRVPRTGPTHQVLEFVDGEAHRRGQRFSALQGTRIEQGGGGVALRGAPGCGLLEGEGLRHVVAHRGVRRQRVLLGEGTQRTARGEQEEPCQEHEAPGPPGETLLPGGECGLDQERCLPTREQLLLGSGPSGLILEPSTGAPRARLPIC